MRCTPRDTFTALQFTGQDDESVRGVSAEIVVYSLVLHIIRHKQSQKAAISVIHMATEILFEVQ